MEKSKAERVRYFKELMGEAFFFCLFSLPWGAVLDILRHG